MSARSLSALVLGLGLSAPLAAQICPNDDVFAPNCCIFNATPLDPTAEGVFLNELVLLPNSVGTIEFNDTFEVLLRPNETLTATATLAAGVSSSFSINVLDASNNALATSGIVPGLAKTIDYRNTGTVSQFVYVNVQNSEPVQCLDYSLQVDLTRCPEDDIFEDFDSCLNPLIFNGQSGDLNGLIAKTDDDDAFLFAVPQGGTLTATVTFSHALGDIDVRAFDLQNGGCASPTQTSETVTNQETIAVTNSNDSTTDFVLEVYQFNAPPGRCSSYDLSWEITSGPPCTQADVFDPNPSLCQSSVFPSPGNYPGLTVSPGDADFFNLAFLGPGASVTLAVDFVHADGDVDLRFWDLTAGCTNATVLANSESTTNTEQIIFVNQTAAPITVFAEVYLFNGACNTYEASFSLASPGLIGGRVCSPTVNSTGLAAFTSASGTLATADNDVILSTINLPPFQFGIYLSSQTWSLTQSPGGSDGLLCLGGDIGRFNGPGQILSSGSFGQTTLQLDLNAIPTPNALVPVMPGETWYFQFWFRDVNASGPTSNFAVATRLRFE